MSPLSFSLLFSSWRTAAFGLLALLCMGLAAPSLRAQETQETHAVAPVDADSHANVEHAEHEKGIPTAAPVLFYGLGGHPALLNGDGTLKRDDDGNPVRPVKFGPFALSNSMLLTWIVAILIIVFARVAMKKVEQIPSGAQNFWEWLVESLRNFLEGVIGRQLTSKTFWFFATIFIFILATNWFGLLPGVGTVGWGYANENGELEHITRPILRGANADLNMTLAMSCIFFGLWIIWAIQSNGFGGAFLHIFGPKGKTEGFMKVLMIVVFALVGLLEVVSIIFRPVSLSFRLYGNIFAGENMLESMSTIYPPLAGVIPIPFYFMELLVGIVQALVFMLLTAVFTLLICSHGEEPHAEEHHH